MTTSTHPPGAHPPPLTPSRSPAQSLPRLARPGPPLRRIAAVALATFGSTFAFAIALVTLIDPPSATSCGADCAITLASHRFATVLGIPALAWAAALHAALGALTWALALSPPHRHALLQSAQLTLVAALLAGSATYLVIGLVTDVRCAICLAMHALAVVAALGAAITPRAPVHAPAPRRLAAALLALAAWLALAWSLGQLATRARAAAPSPSAPTDRWLAAVCDPSTCPDAAHFGPDALPDDDASLVLARGPGPTLVAWLDLDCPACRADFAAQEPLYRRLVQEGRGLRLVFRASSRACDARADHGDPSRCEAPSAIICAARHAGPDAALDLLQRELSAAPGYFTRDDRRQALAALTATAARCFDAELALGPRGTLAAHAEAARRLAAAARTHPGCAAQGDDAPWWCFAATPSFAIAHATPPRPSTEPTARALAWSAATGELRADVLERCLELP